MIPESPFVVLAEGSKLHQYEKLMFFSDIDGYSVRLNGNELQLFKMESDYPKANPLKVKGKTATVKYSKLNKKNGKVTVKKGLKKGTYEVTVKVKAAGNEKYQASSWKKVTFKVRIK